MQQQMASVPLPNTEIYMVALVHAIDYAGLSTELVNQSSTCPMVHEDEMDHHARNLGHTNLSHDT